MRSKVRLLALLFTAVLLLSAGCGGTAGVGGGGDGGTVYVVGTEAAYPPFEMINEETGEFEGFDIELMEAIAEEAGFSVEWQNVAWDALGPALQTGQIDLIISAMTITDERAVNLQFSDPYFTAGQVILVRADNNDIQGPQDLAGRKVGVQAGTTGQFAVEKIEGVAADDILTFETTPDAFNALVNANVDAVVADLPVVAEFVKNNPQAGVKQVGSNFTVEYYGIAMRHGEPELLQLVNRGLAAVKASGRYDEIYNKYFGE